MSDAILIPFKKLSLAKSRLSNFLNQKQRIEFTELMLKDVLNSCLKSSFSKIFLITQEEFNKPWLVSNKIEIIQDEGELNEALERTIKKLNFDLFLILPADIPLIETEDLEAILSLSKEFDVVISPSIDGGTNALLLKKGKEIKFEYNLKNSSLLHLKNALSLNLKVCILTNERIALDIDDIVRLKYLINKDLRKESIFYAKSIFITNEEDRDL